MDHPFDEVGDYRDITIATHFTDDFYDPLTVNYLNDFIDYCVKRQYEVEVESEHAAPFYALNEEVEAFVDTVGQPIPPDPPPADTPAKPGGKGTATGIATATPKDTDYGRLRRPFTWSPHDIIKRTFDTNKMIHRSRIRNADVDSSKNVRVDTSNDSDSGEKDPLLIRSKLDQLKGETSGTELVEIDPSDLIGRTFLRPDNDSGESHRVELVSAIVDREAKPSKDLTRVKFVCYVNNDEYGENVTYNELLNHVERESDENEIVWKFRKILAHQGPLSPHSPHYKGSARYVLVDLESGEKTYEPMKLIAADDPVTLAMQEPQAFCDILTSTKYDYKLKGAGPISYHLGCEFFHDSDGVLYSSPRNYVDKMVDGHARIYGEKPSLKVTSPIEKGDHPELDTSELFVRC